jgi:von Willebrand factor type A domain
MIKILVVSTLLTFCAMQNGPAISAYGQTNGQSSVKTSGQTAAKTSRQTSGQTAAKASGQASGQTAAKASGQASVKKQTKLYGHVDEVNYALNAAGVTLDADKLPALVGNVRLGSPAYYGGLSENDKVLQGKIQDNKLNLLIERGGKRYALSVNTSPIDLSKEQPKKDGGQIPVLSVVPKDAPVLDVRETEKEKEKQLSNYDVVIVIDTSGSMNFHLSSEPTTKWQWCATYIHNFAEKMRPILTSGLTIVTFNNKYQIEPHCSPERVESIFQSTTPVGGTDMATPLNEVLKSYLATSRSRPLLIAVLTDGMPNLGPKVEDVIIDATRDMRTPGEIRMTFLEIGEEFDGQKLIKLLDDYLVYEGAKYDIVDSLTFDEVKQMGLVDALKHAINEKSTIASTTNPLRAELSKLKQEIEQQRAAVEQHRAAVGQRRSALDQEHAALEQRRSALDQEHAALEQRRAAAAAIRAAAGRAPATTLQNADGKPAAKTAPAPSKQGSDPKPPAKPEPGPLQQSSD